MRVVDLINKKKTGNALTKEEIRFFMKGYLDGSVADYQMSSMLMAICFQGLNVEEETALTLEILESGDKIDLSSLSQTIVDKHSTGGVGDKTTLVIAPILASLGLTVAKMSGRGLGHTGGTVDKLESIPSFRTEITNTDFLMQVKDISLAIISQSANIAPLDKMLYALRDVTATVDEVSLIASSIMSKKLASGADYILLDVKVGDGAFMKTMDEAKSLANSLVRIGNSAGKQSRAIISNMDQPLGNAVGNALEVIEAIETLKGRGPKDLEELVFSICINLLLMTDKASSESDAREKIRAVIENGKALNKLEEMITLQGGDARVINDYSKFPTARNVYSVQSSKSGYIGRIKTEEIGKIAMMLGAGRSKKDDVLDLAVGIKLHKKVGDYVNVGEVVAELHVNRDDDIEKLVGRLKRSIKFQSDKPKKNEMILGLIK